MRTLVTFMSRIGQKPIQLPDSVTFHFSPQERLVTLKGPLGELQHRLPHQINLEHQNNTLIITRRTHSKTAKSLHGLTRALLANMVTGVTQGYQKTLELVGTGYRVAKQGNKLVISVGYSHPVEYPQPEGITLEVEGNNIIKVKGIDKQLVGQVAAEIRAIRKPEPYKGKGIRYQGEQVRRKAGKAAKGTGA